jgi:catechol 2,3-dioxygenase-like lactoylglutathione lyase family enzyme
MGLSVEHLDHWTLVTSDLARTRRFYTDVLGAVALDRTFPAGVTFGGTTIDFFEEDEQQYPSPGSDHHAYAIALDDFDGWVEQLRTHGVGFHFANFGRTRMSVLFDDPDGYHFELVVPMESEEVASRELAKRGIEPGDRQGFRQVAPVRS